MSDRQKAPPAPDLAALWRAVATHPGIVIECQGDDAAETWNRLCRAMEAANAR